MIQLLLWMMKTVWVCLMKIICKTQTLNLEFGYLIQWRFSNIIISIITLKLYWMILIRKRNIHNSSVLASGSSIWLISSKEILKYKKKLIHRNFCKNKNQLIHQLSIITKKSWPNFNINSKILNFKFSSKINEKKQK